jgi:hypothetical protein
LKSRGFVSPRSRVPVPETIRQELIALRQAGKSLEEISEALSLKKKVVEYQLTLAGARLSPDQVRANQRQVDDSIRDRILDLRDKALTRVEIAARLGVKVSFVKTVLAKAKKTLDPAIRQEHAHAARNKNRDAWAQRRYGVSSFQGLMEKLARDRRLFRVEDYGHRKWIRKYRL